MLEIMPYIILILLIIAFEWLQIYLSEHKIGKWVLPVLSFLFSLFVMLNLIVFELGDYREPKNIGLKEIFSATAWGNFPVLNIPTIIFILTNVIMKRINKNKPKD